MVVRSHPLYFQRIWNPKPMLEALQRVIPTGEVKERPLLVHFDAHHLAQKNIVIARTNRAMDLAL